MCSLFLDLKSLGPEALSSCLSPKQQEQLACVCLAEKETDVGRAVIIHLRMKTKMSSMEVTPPNWVSTLQPHPPGEGPGLGLSQGSPRFPSTALSTFGWKMDPMIFNVCALKCGHIWTKSTQGFFESRLTCKEGQPARDTPRAEHPKGKANLVLPTIWEREAEEMPLLLTVLRCQGQGR